VQASGPDLHTITAAGSCLQSVRGEAHSSHIRSEGEERGGIRRGKVCMSLGSGVRGDCRVCGRRYGDRCRGHEAQVEECSALIGGVAEN
jgi:hypothetical protein